MDRQDLLFVVLPFVALALFSIGVVVLFRHRWRMDRAAVRRAARLVEPDIVTPPRDPTPGRRPWWGSPWLWVGVSAAFAVLGLLVWTTVVGRRVPVRPVRVDLAAQVTGGGSALERTREARRPVLAGCPRHDLIHELPDEGGGLALPPPEVMVGAFQDVDPRDLNSVPMVRSASGGQYSSRSPARSITGVRSARSSAPRGIAGSSTSPGSSGRPISTSADTRSSSSVSRSATLAPNDHPHTTLGRPGASSPTLPIAARASRTSSRPPPNVPPEPITPRKLNDRTAKPRWASSLRTAQRMGWSLLPP